DYRSAIRGNRPRHPLAPVLSGDGRRKPDRRTSLLLFVSSSGGPACRALSARRRRGRVITPEKGNRHGSLSLAGSRGRPRRGGGVLGALQGGVLARRQYRAASGFDPG